MGNALRLGISKIGLAWTRRRMKTTIRRNPISLLILGTQATGKTTIALRLWKYKKTLPDLHYVQTKGFNTYSVKRNKKSTINLYDLGGHPSIQELWIHYYADAHGVIFVVDVSNQASLADAGVVFAKVLNDERIRGKPILLLANKQDLGGASEVELDSLMNLQEVVNSARCLTRLGESTATDLKKDKGIFDGFRWLVSYIEDHYHELNERVIHDVLEEKNREKARRAAVKEQMDKASVSPTASPQKANTDTGKSTQNPVPPLQPKEHEAANRPKTPQEMETPVTNYLIRARPNSSTGEGYNPFLVKRAISTAPHSERRRTLPFLSSLGRGDGKMNPFLVRQNPLVDQQQLVESSGGSPRRDSENTNTMSTSVASGMNTAAGRLSPEGADSDEGIVNPAFENETETEKEKLSETNAPVTVVTVQPAECVEPNANAQDSEGGREAVDVDVDVGVPVPDVEASVKLPFSPPNNLRKLIRTESSDTERAGEILMVTTLVQVHQNQISKDRRGSTTSTHDSVALSLTSFKSEDMSNATNPDYVYGNGWDSTSIPESQTSLPNFPHSSTTPLQLQLPSSDVELQPPSGIIAVGGSGSNTNTNSNPGSKVTETSSSTRIEKGSRKTGIRLGKNKTAPAPPPPLLNPPGGMIITTVEENRGQPVAMGMSQSHSLNSTRPQGKEGGGKTKLKKKSLSGFSPDSRENSRSQLVREGTLNQIERLKKY